MPRPVLLLAAAAPLALVLAILARYALPVPILDDYHLVLGFALDLSRLHTLPQRLLLDLTAQHGEYRMMLLHLLLHAQIALVGHVSLGPFLWVGNLIFLPIITLFWINFLPAERSCDRRLLLFLPVVYLVATLVYVEQLDWMEGVLYYIGPLSLASLSALSRSQAAHAQARFGRCRMLFALAVLALVLACLLSAQGFFLVPIGAWLLVRERRPNLAAAAKQIALWLLAPAPALAAYFYRYQPVPHPNVPSLLIRVSFFFSFLGGSVENMHHRPVSYAATALGVIVFAVFAHAAWTRFDREQPALFSFALWCLLTAALTASVRADMGLQQSLSGRYKIYCVELLAFCYVYGVARCRDWSPAHGRRVFVGALAISVALSLAGTAAGWSFLKRRDDGLLAGLAWYRADPSRHSPLTHMGKLEDQSPELADAARRNLNDAIAAGLYTLPPAP